jgi:Ca2+-binding EF-hand superfamily protein
VNHVDEWLTCLRSTFQAMDADKDGRLKPNEILQALKAKLPEAEVRGVGVLAVNVLDVCC